MKPLLISIAILVLYAPVADAAEFNGRTSQDRRVFLKTDADGLPVRVALRWHASCDPEGRLVLPTGFMQPFRESTQTFLRDGGPYTTSVRDKEGREYKVRVRARIRGHLVDDDTWRGRFRASARVSRNGELVSTCTKRGIRWRATR